MTGPRRLLPVLLFLFTGCVFGAPESRPPAFLGKAGLPRPDGCTLADYLSARTPPFPVEDIATISVVAPSKDQCVAHLVRHEACYYGGDVVYGLETGRNGLGQDVPTVWCAARVARTEQGK
jgi:hypothetical protein